MWLVLLSWPSVDVCRLRHYGYVISWTVFPAKHRVHSVLMAGHVQASIMPTEYPFSVDIQLVLAINVSSCKYVFMTIAISMI
jgi:hypothetical protein